MTNPLAPPVAAIPETVTDNAPTLHKGHYRKKKKPGPPKRKPAKATLPNGKYFEKRQFRKLRLNDKESRQKIRGRKKKEAARLNQLENKDGQFMACKEAPEWRPIIYASDIAKIRGIDIRTARTQFNMIMKKLGKEKHHLLTAVEYCKEKKIPIETIIPYLK